MQRLVRHFQSYTLGKLLVKNHREDQPTPLPFQGTKTD